MTNKYLNYKPSLFVLIWLAFSVIGLLGIFYFMHTNNPVIQKSIMALMIVLTSVFTTSIIGIALKNRKLPDLQCKTEY